MVKFVRLACLMCAASVYPEPGSNSQYNFEFFQALFINFNFLIFFWFTFWYFFISKEYRLVFSLKDSLFTFQCTFSFCCLCRTICILTYLFLFVNTFLNFFQNYFLPFLRQNKKLVIDVFCLIFVLLFTNSYVIILIIFVCCLVRFLY